MNDEAVDTQEVPLPEPTKRGHVTLQMGRRKSTELGLEWREGNLDYGPASLHDPNHNAINLKFNDGICVTVPDHPLIAEVMERYPVTIVTTESKTKTYVDADGREFKSKSQMKAAAVAKENRRKTPPQTRSQNAP